jgi:hypothetical protein
MNKFLKTAVFAAILHSKAWAADPLDERTVSNTANLKRGLYPITSAQGQFVAVGDGGTLAKISGDKWFVRLFAVQ